MEIECPSAMLHRALGDDGFAIYQEERGVAENYTLTPIQADAILRMTLGQLVNLEQEKLGGEHRELLEKITEYNRILSDVANIHEIIRDDLREIKRKFGDDRRTEVSGEEIGEVDLDDLITEETMVVSISSQGYIKRTPASVYRIQRRGGKGLRGAKTEEEDPIQHLFVASTHDYLLFFTNLGKVYWRKVYGLPQLPRDRRGRAIVNLLELDEGEFVADCRAVRDFDEPDHYLMTVSRKGLVKKTALSAYRRPLARGLIAVKLREDDELVDVVVTKPGDEVILSMASGMAIRFRESDIRPMGRGAAGNKGVTLVGDDFVVGMVTTEPDAYLLTVCANGYGKRTPLGPNALAEGETPPEDHQAEEAESSTRSYRTQKRGGKGLRDIKTTKRNGPVVASVRVTDEDELLMISARGQLQRIRAADISVVGRNTQGVRVMNVDEDDTLVAVKRVPREEDEPEEGLESEEAVEVSENGESTEVVEANETPADSEDAGEPNEPAGSEEPSEPAENAEETPGEEAE